MLLSAAALLIAFAEPRVREADFKASDGKSYHYIIREPDAAARVGGAGGAGGGIAVLLIGGGSVTSEDWFVPGSFEQEGRTTRATIDGQPTRDARTIALALVARGFTVMQWSSIHTEDAIAKATPGMAEPIPYPKSVEIAGEALRTLREQPGVDPKKIILIGHSLGAARACQIADDGVIGMGFLAGAYLSKTDGAPIRVVPEEFQKFQGLDGDHDGTISRTEFTGVVDHSGPPLPATFDAVDHDHDGKLRAWEIVASSHIERANAGETFTTKKPTLADRPWPAEVIAARPTPILALFGSLDPMSYHGVWLERMVSQGRKQLDVEYFPGLGHQLGAEEGKLIGPIDSAVVSRLVDWAMKIATEPRPEAPKPPAESR